MAEAERQALAKETANSLVRMQEFDADSIARVEELGRGLNFKDAVPDVKRIVELFRQVSVDVLSEFSIQRLQVVKQIADAEFNRLQQILQFSPVTSGTGSVAAAVGARPGCPTMCRRSAE